MPIRKLYLLDTNICVVFGFMYLLIFHILFAVLVKLFMIFNIVCLEELFYDSDNGTRQFCNANPRCLYYVEFRTFLCSRCSDIIETFKYQLIKLTDVDIFCRISYIAMLSMY